MGYELFSNRSYAKIKNRILEVDCRDCQFYREWPNVMDCAACCIEAHNIIMCGGYLYPIDWLGQKINCQYFVKKQ